MADRTAAGQEPRQGQVLTGDFLAWLVRLVLRGRLTVDASSGLRAQVGPAGTHLTYEPGPAALYVLTPAGGIPARSGATLGSAACAFLALDPATGVLSDAGWSDTVFNASSTAVGGGKYGIAERVDGAWSIVVESCA